MEAINSVTQRHLVRTRRELQILDRELQGWTLYAAHSESRHAKSV